MIPWAAVLLLSALTCAAVAGRIAGAQAAGGREGESCGFADGRPAAGRLLLDGRPLLYRFDPAPPRVGRPLAVDLLSCTADPPDLVEVDAVMPAHRHGMNYRPKLHNVGPGSWRAEGLLLHMPGEWRFDFSFRDAAGAMQVQTLLIVR